MDLLVNMNNSRPASAKIIQHSQGMGLPNDDTVRERASELATIDGRTQYNDQDWHRALAELHGGHQQAGDTGETDMAALVSEHDMILGGVGHRAHTVGPQNDQNLGEELMAEGMDEALHEQMLAARGEEPTDDES